VCQLLEQRAIQTAWRAVIDIFDGGVVAQARVSQSRPEPPVLTIRQLAVEQQAKPFSVIEVCAARVGDQFLEGARHAGQAELTQLFECWMGQQIPVIKSKNDPRIHLYRTKTNSVDARFRIYHSSR
jgi:hypothetical protein